MPFEIDLGSPRIGYALQNAREGEEVPICFRDFRSTEDGQQFIQMLESFAYDILTRLPTPVNPSQIDHMLVIYHGSGKAEVYLNELDLKARTRVTGPVEAGGAVSKNDVAEIESLDLGVEIPVNAGFMFVFSVGWRKGLIFDYGPVVPQNPQPREYDVPAALGQAFCNVLFQERFGLTGNEWRSLFAAQWFLFAGLSNETIESLIAHIRAAWDPDERLDEILSEVRGRVPQMLESWRNHTSLQPEFQILSRATVKFLNGNYVGCAKLLFPSIRDMFHKYISCHKDSLSLDNDSSPKSEMATGIENDKSLLFPLRFSDYVRDVYFADFDPTSQNFGDSKDGIELDLNNDSKFYKKSALLGLLIVQQLNYLFGTDNSQDMQVIQEANVSPAEANSIDPIHALALSVKSTPGAYALLLGSGISREAGILSGWDITLDLVRQLALLHEEDCELKPVDWYKSMFGKDPDYSSLLAELAPMPAERQRLLLPYFESTAEERKEGKKKPTLAHRAIAQLAASGYVRVIITTNFDQLLETAMREIGFEPTVLSTEDQVKNALPLIHIKCCVLKIHGDYLDARILNTPDELKEYSQPINERLREVFENFGLIVCGWSAEYDGALREALNNPNPSSFSTFWTRHTNLNTKAQSIVDRREAQVIPIDSAGKFFSEIHRKVEALERSSPQRPLSTRTAVDVFKRYLSDSSHPIQLTELIDRELRLLLLETNSQTFKLEGSLERNTDSVTRRIRAYEAACGSLMALAVVGGRWAQEMNFSLWQRVLKRLCMMPFVGGVDSLWLNMRLYPGTLLLYALGLGAVESDRLYFLGRLFSTRVQQQLSEEQYAVELFAPANLFHSDSDMKLLEGMEERHVPLNDWLFSYLQKFTKEFILDEYHYTYTFVKFEILLALHASHHGKNSWKWEIPVGVFRYKLDAASQVIKELEGSISSLNDTSPFVESGVFGESADSCAKAIADFKEWLVEYFSPLDKRYWEHLFR